MKHALPYTLIAMLLFISSCSMHEDSEYIQTADSLLWANPDSCLLYIAEHKEELSSKDMPRMELIYQHATYKMSLYYGNDSLLQDMAEAFIRKSDYRSAGEAKYIQGANLVQQGKHFEATIALKEAETLFNRASNVRLILKGMLYFNLGAATERSRFFNVAKEYYETAIPYLKKSSHPLYLSTAYQHLSKCCDDIDTVMVYLDSAYSYAQRIETPLYRIEIDVIRSLVLQPSSTAWTQQTINELKTLTDEYQLIYYAPYLVQSYISEGDLNNAEHYLDILSGDTAIDVWGKEQYYSLKADLLHAQGNNDEAFTVYKELHQHQTSEIQSAAYANTYIISQKYDAAREQELRLQETVKKQRAYIWIALSMLLCAIIGGGSYYIYKKGQYELKLSEEQKKRMAQELDTHKAILRTRISERLQVARKIHFWGSHHNEKIPEELNILSPTQATKDIQNWRRFYDEFNLCFSNLLLKLQEKHPDLTDSDLQYIALTFLGFDITDLCFLLGITNRTIWNRRSIVKQHLNLPEGKNQDEWIVKEMPQEFGLVEAERRPRRRQDKKEEQGTFT